MNLTDKVQDTIATTLNVPGKRIREQTAADDLEEWDSLGQINLMMTLEQTFDISLDVEDFQNLSSVPAIVEYLTQQGISA